MNRLGAHVLDELSPQRPRKCERAGIAYVSPHRLRPTAPTEMLRAGASLSDIGQLLRHAAGEPGAGLAAAQSLRTRLYAATLETVIGLLAVSGLRVGEIVRLEPSRPPASSSAWSTQFRNVCSPMPKLTSGAGDDATALFGLGDRLGHHADGSLFQLRRVPPGRRVLLCHDSHFPKVLERRATQGSYRLSDTQIWLYLRGHRSGNGACDAPRW
jgi:hypothetical protein